MTELFYGVYDEGLGDWDSGPHASIDEAERHTFVVVLPPGTAGNHKLTVREWLVNSRPGRIVGGP
jgi:hypothetical protein